MTEHEAAQQIAARIIGCILALTSIGFGWSLLEGLFNKTIVRIVVGMGLILLGLWISFEVIRPIL